MKIKRINKTLVEFNDGAYRIEASPIRRKEKATKELLDNNVTASHYLAGKPDAVGKPIEIGKEMEFIDWKGEDRCHVVYKNVGGKFNRVGEHPDYETALGATVELINAEK